MKKAFYIRFGSIPEGERSTIGAAPNFIAALYGRIPGAMESGVSVYDVEWSERLRRWQIKDVGNLVSLDELLAQRRPALLVTGRELRTTGADGEPLLRSVEIVQQLSYSDLYVPAWGSDGFIEEFLEEKSSDICLGS